MDADQSRYALGCRFFGQLSHRWVDIDVEQAVAVEFDITDDMRGPAGSVHGGLIAMIVDVAGASCLARATSRPVATSSTSIQYLSAGRVGPVRAISTLLRASDTLGVAEVRVVDVGKDSRLMAAAHVTCKLLAGESFIHKTS